VSSDFQLTVAVVALPAESVRPIGEPLLAPPALFQWLNATTPATSELAIATPFPTNWMLIGFPEVLDVVTIRFTVAVWVRAPLVPVIVSVGLPIGVLPVVVTVRVELPEVVIEAGENVAVAPLGNPLVTPRLTALPKPLSAPTLTVYVAVPPGFTENELGEAESVKSGGAPTLRVTVAVCVAPAALVPVMVRTLLPGGVLLARMTVRVELPAWVMEVGENEAVAPEGRPAAAKLTWPVKPKSAPTVMV